MPTPLKSKIGKRMPDAEIKKRGRPSTRNEEGFTIAQQKLLLYRQGHRGATGEEACRETGVALNTFRRYRKDKSVLGQRWMQRWNSFGPLTDQPEVPDFISFRQDYLNVPSFNPYTGRTAMVGVTHPYMREVCELLDDTSVRFKGILLPVRFAKTTLVEQGIIKRLCQNPNARIILVTSSLSLAKERVYNIQRVLQDKENYPQLHSKWGPWISKPDARPWTATSFYVSGRNSPERSPSVEGFGITAKNYGKRADLIVLDDIDDPDNNDTARETSLRTLNGSLLSRLSEGGELWYIGTRCGVNDIPSHLLRLPGWKWIVRAAYNEDGTPLAPEMYSEEDLEAFRTQMGEQLFQMLYMNNPAPEGSIMFPPVLLDNAKGQFDDAPEDWERWTGLDPAASGRAAIVTVAHNPHTREIRVIDCEAKVNPRHDGLMAMVRSQLVKHRSKYMVIEAQGGSHFFSDVPEAKDLIYDEGARLITFQTTGANKHDHQFGIPLLAREMERERLRLGNGPRTSTVLKPLLDDLGAWVPAGTKRTFDTVMALWFVVNSIISGQRGSRKGTRIDPVYLQRPFLQARWAQQQTKAWQDLVNSR